MNDHICVQCVYFCLFVCDYRVRNVNLKEFYFHNPILPYSVFQLPTPLPLEDNRSLQLILLPTALQKEQVLSDEGGSIFPRNSNLI